MVNESTLARKDWQMWQDEIEDDFEKWQVTYDVFCVDY